MNEENPARILWDALYPGPGENPYPLRSELTYEDGIKEERARIIAYLMEKDVLREALFYNGYVAMNTSGTTGIDLSPTLGGEE